MPLRETGSESAQEAVALAGAVLGGDRRALARAITLVESTRRDHRALASELLKRLMPNTGRAIRLGISGAPGVGKSTFIEALGNHLAHLAWGTQQALKFLNFFQKFLVL